MERRAPTRAEVDERLASMPAQEAARIRETLRPADPNPGPETEPAIRPPPIYQSCDDFHASTTPSERRRWCAAKAKKANNDRPMSARPEARVTAEQVLAILEAARGRCTYCGSLAVEKRPSTANGSPLPWESVGRRIGSLTHLTERFNDGENTVSNLAWCCLWCNTWSSERIPGATDRGAHHPPE